MKEKNMKAPHRTCHAAGVLLLATLGLTAVVASPAAHAAPPAADRVTTLPVIDNTSGPHVESVVKDTHPGYTVMLQQFKRPLLPLAVRRTLPANDTVLEFDIRWRQDRAGFYTHNWVEKLLLSGIPDVHEIHPEWQDLKVGDLMRTNREIRAGHPLGWSVAIVDPDRALVVRSKSLPRGTYAFVLEPIDGQTTRLIARDRAVWSWWQFPFVLLVYEPLHAYMQTGVLQGIKQRVERAVS